MEKQTRIFVRHKAPGEYSTLFAEVQQKGQPLAVGKLSLQNWLADGAESITVTIAENTTPLPVREGKP